MHEMNADSLRADHDSRFIANIRTNGVWQRTCMLLVCNILGVH